MEYKIAYCFNGWTWIWRQLVLSLTTLHRFPIEKENIIVFYGPPRFQEHIDWLEPRCDLRLVETPLDDPDFKSTRKHRTNKFYGGTMKLHAYNLDTPNLIWIDSDTIIHRDVREMFEGDFDILLSRWDHSAGKTTMRGLCKTTGLPHMDIMMDGMMVFKNRTHNKMRPDYLAYMKKLFMDELKPPRSDRICLYAFMLALIKFKQSGGKVVEMTPNWHKYAGGRYVQHLARREIATWMEKKIFTPEMYKLVEVGVDDRAQ